MNKKTEEMPVIMNALGSRGQRECLEALLLPRLNDAASAKLQSLLVLFKNNATKRNFLAHGYWHLEEAWVTRVGREPEQFATYIVSTYLSPERVKDALGTVISMSVFDLPTMIDVAEKAGLSASVYKIQYQLLLSRPALLMTMVLLGATVSLRSFRSGRIQTMVVTGMLGGFGFFLMAEVSRQVGVASLVSPLTAIWVPVIAATFVSLTVLLHQEDG